MKIAFIASSFKRNFFEQMIRWLPESVEAEILDVASCFSQKGWLLPSKRLLADLRELEPDVVYTDYPQYPVWYAKLYQSLARRRITTVLNLHGNSWEEFYSWLATFSSGIDRLFIAHRYYFAYSSIALADAVTPICEALNQTVLRHFPSKRTFVVPQGVSPEFFYQERGAISLEHPNVCIIQNHTIWPKVRGLLQFARVVKELPDVHFYVAGGQPITQPYAALVAKTFTELKNAHLLSSIHYPDGIRQLLSETDLYVLASGLDMCPTTVLEASLMEKPVVASRVGGVPEIVMEGKTGYTVPNEDVGLWTRRIRSVLNDRKLARELGRNGRQLVYDNFRWEKIAEKTIQAIRFAWGEQ